MQGMEMRRSALTPFMVLVMTSVVGCGRSSLQPGGRGGASGASVAPDVPQSQSGGVVGGAALGGSTGRETSPTGTSAATRGTTGSGGTTGAPVWIGAFVPTGGMRTDMGGVTATLLLDGKVLITGNGKAELYDPKTGLFASTGDPAVTRFGHTVTLLPDGRVLVAGGHNRWTNHDDPETSLASAELFDPATGTLSAAGAMTAARDGHTAVLLSNGTVLIAGGLDEKGVLLASAELYDPATAGFVRTHDMTEVRRGHTATLLPNGMILLTGGFGDPTRWPVGYHTAASAELYDSASGTFTATGSMTTQRCRHTATLLQNGIVLVVGGSDYKSWALTSAELYDTMNGTFSTTGDMTVVRESHTATLLNNGKVLIAGGQEDENSSVSEQPLASAELYDPVTGTFVVTGSMMAARVGHAATLLGSGNVLIVGGGLLRAELYQ